MSVIHLDLERHAADLLAQRARELALAESARRLGLFLLAGAHDEAADKLLDDVLRIRDRR